MQQSYEEPHGEPRDHGGPGSRAEPRPDGCVHPHQSDAVHEIERHPQRDRAVHGARVLTQCLHPGGDVRAQPNAVDQPVEDVQHHAGQQPAHHHATPVDLAHDPSYREEDRPSATGGTLRARPWAVKQACASKRLCACVLWSYGTSSTATVPPKPSDTVVTPLGTAHSVPLTRMLK